MKARIEFNRYGSSGNVFDIISRTCAVLDLDTVITMFDRVKSSGSYDEALKIIGEYVELVEVSGVE